MSRLYMLEGLRPMEDHTIPWQTVARVEICRRRRSVDRSGVSRRGASPLAGFLLVLVLVLHQMVLRPDSWCSGGQVSVSGPPSPPPPPLTSRLARTSACLWRSPASSNTWTSGAVVEPGQLVANHLARKGSTSCQLSSILRVS